MMNWNFRETNVLLSKNLTIDNRLQHATQKQTDTFTDYCTVSFLYLFFFMTQLDILTQNSKYSEISTDKSFFVSSSSLKL